MPPKPNGPVWAWFRPAALDATGAPRLVQCSHAGCTYKGSPNATRMANHLAASHDWDMKSLPSNPASPVDVDLDSSSQTTSSTSSVPTPKRTLDATRWAAHKKRSVDLTTFFDRILDSDQQEHLERAQTFMSVMANVSGYSQDNPAFRYFLKQLRPAYKPLTGRTLTSRVLKLAAECDTAGLAICAPSPSWPLLILSEGPTAGSQECVSCR